MMARAQGGPRASRAVAILGLGCMALGWPAAVAGQGTTGHEHHREAMAAKPAAAAHAMETQPALDGILLVDATGRTVALGELVTTDTPVMLNFIFTSCTTICPVMSAGFARLAERVAAGGGKVRLVSISIDPEVDTPARLREYAAGIGAGQGWVFLTGSVPAVERAQRAFGAYRGSKEAHVAATFVRRSATVPWERVDGLASAETLVRAYTGAASEPHEPGSAR